jgi:hypothetical protein
MKRFQLRRRLRTTGSSEEQMPGIPRNYPQNLMLSWRAGMAVDLSIDTVCPDT